MSEVSREQAQIKTDGKSIKVLHLIDSGGLYGAEVMLLNLVEEQTKLGMHPVILSAGNYGCNAKGIETEAIKRNLTLKIFRMKPGLNLIRAWDILCFARKEKFDIIHSHGYKFNVLMGVFPRFIRKIPVITTLHGYVSATNSVSMLKVYQILDRACLRFLDGIVFVSDALKKHPLLKKQSFKKSKVIFNGLNIDNLNSILSDEESTTLKSLVNVEDNIFYFGSVGRLSPEKGFDILLKAFKLLTLKNENIRLLIVGDGPLDSSLKLLSETLNIGNKVTFTGFVSPAARIINEVNALVISSFSEGMPIVMIEAGLMEKTIVATSVGGIPSALEEYDSAVLVESNNILSLEEGMSQALKGVQTKGYCFNKWKEAFAASTMNESYLSFYKQVLKEYS